MAFESATYENLKALLEEQSGQYDFALIERAYNLSYESHKDQKRASGEPYFHHPFSVTKIIISMGMDSESICAGLLHDVVEDTDVTLAQIEKLFNKNVAILVDGVTKLGKISISREQQQSENIRKMLIAMSEDIRVIIIKLADRLHNMRTLDYLPDQKQRDISLETIEVYAPIAHRLGIRAVKEELEDLSIKHLDPIAYDEVTDLLNARKIHRDEFLNRIQDKIRTRVAEFVPEIYVEGRIKSIHGIYRKMYMQNKSFDEIYDVYAVRVITDSIVNCYNILGVIHDTFRPIPNRFKDYISTPKPNMYQSLHTTVIDREGIPFEVQIRTWDMHHTAEYGIAAHWKYKAGIEKNDIHMEERLTWIRQIIESQKEADAAEDIIQTIKTDLSQEDVFAVTPKGDVINLPAGATVIDFAYAVHTQVGNKMTGAKVDGRIVPFNYEIKTGEIIEILTTSAAGHGPSRDWLKIAKSSQTRSKIRSWFKKERRTENIATGKAELEREIARNAIRLPEADLAKFIEDTARRQKCATVDDFYAAIGYGGISLSRIMPHIKDEYAKLLKSLKPTNLEDLLKPQSKRSKSHDGIVVEGIDNCLIKLSKCCTPLPGDDIIGFITRGHGVSIHKCDCNNVPKNIANCEEPERWVAAYWDNDKNETFKASLQILAIDRPGVFANITMIISNLHVALHSISGKETKDGNCIINATMSVESTEHLKSIFAKIEKVPGVISVERMHA